jgi:hypothetical protein
MGDIRYGERETPATTDQTALVSPLATTDQAATETGTTSKTPTPAETKETTTTKAAEQGTTTHTAVAAPTASGSFSILNPVGGSRSLTPPPPLSPTPKPPPPHSHSTTQHTITTCKPCNTPPQDGSDSDSDYAYIDSSHNDEADHDEERAARKVHLLLSEIPAPAWQDIVMDRSAWNKMLRSIYTN